VNKLDRVPFDKFGRSLDQISDRCVAFRADRYPTVPEARATLSAASHSFNAANAALAQDALLQCDIRQAAIGLRRTLVSLNSLADYLQWHPESVLRGTSSSHHPGQ
jgi:paraquat-inducible protein B